MPSAMLERDIRCPDRHHQKRSCCFACRSIPISTTSSNGTHRPICQELEAAPIDHGVMMHSIHRDETTHDLFGYVKVDNETRWATVADTEVCQRRCFHGPKILSQRLYRRWLRH